MENIALIDHGTLSASHAILYAGNTPFYPGDTDIAISCLSGLLENIILFDKLILPGVPHGFSEQLSHAFGDAIELRPIHGELWHHIEIDSVEWLSDKVDLKSALDFSHLDLGKRHCIGSTDKGIAAALSVLNDESFSTTYDILFAFEPYAKSDSLDNSSTWKHEWDIDSRLIDKLNNTYGEDYKKLFKNDDPVFMFAALDLKNMYWGVFRSRCYDMLSRAFELPYLPHPLRARSELAVRCLDMEYLESSNPFLSVLTEVYDEGRQFVYDKTGDWIEPFTLSPLFPYILSKCKTKDDILSQTYKIRDSRGARTLRKRLATYGEAESLKDKVDMIKELESLKGMLERELGLKSSEHKVSFNIAGMISTTLPIPKGILKYIGKHITISPNSRLLFLRNIYKEMSQAAGLGKYYEFLTKSTRDKKKLQYTDNDIKVRAQYLYAIFINLGRKPAEAYSNTYKTMKQLTMLPSSRIFSLLNESISEIETSLE